MIVNLQRSPIFFFFLYLQSPSGINYLATYFVPFLCPYQLGQNRVRSPYRKYFLECNYQINYHIEEYYIEKQTLDKLKIWIWIFFIKKQNIQEKVTVYEQIYKILFPQTYKKK